MVDGRHRPRFWMVVLCSTLATPVAAVDPCFLTMTEARELGGSDVSQASGDATRCSYVTSSGASRLTIDLYSVATAEAQSRLEELGDSSRFVTRQKSRATIWTSRADELVGWARRSESLARLQAEGAASPKRRRALEHALFRVAERLR